MSDHEQGHSQHTAAGGRVINGKDRDMHILGSPDPFLNILHGIIRLAVKALSLLMVVVIIWGIFDVLWILYSRMTTPPYFLLSIHDILATFGAFMAVLIAIEIFINISMYLQHDVIHIRLVLDTAIMAAARKVIVLDFKQNSAMEVVALGAVILALGLCYWLVVHRSRHGDHLAERSKTTSDPTA